MSAEMMRPTRRILYSTDALHRNGDQSGKQFEGSFASLDAAKNAPFPLDCTFAVIKLDGGHLVNNSDGFGWQFFGVK